MSDSALPTETDVRVDDDDASFSYSPDGAWKRNFTSPSPTHVTSRKNAQAIVTFVGTRVWFYGDMSPTHSFFNVSIDGGEAITLSSFADAWVQQQLLYTSPAMPAGSHLLHLTSVGSGTPFEVDYIIYRPNSGSMDNQTLASQSASTTPATPSTATTSIPKSSNANSNGSRTQTIVIAVCVVLIVLLSVPAFLLIRRRYNRNNRRPSRSPPPPTSMLPLFQLPSLPPQPPPYCEPPAAPVAHKQGMPMGSTSTAPTTFSSGGDQENRLWIYM